MTRLFACRFLLQWPIKQCWPFAKQSAQRPKMTSSSRRFCWYELCRACARSVQFFSIVLLQASAAGDVTSPEDLTDINATDFDGSIPSPGRRSFLKKAIVAAKKQYCAAQVHSHYQCALRMGLIIPFLQLAPESDVAIDPIQA